MTANSKQVAEILTDPTASNWLKDALTKLVTRDPLDALNDVEILHEILKARWKETLNSY